MIDSKIFEILWRYGYEEKSDAYDVVREGFSDVKGVTVIRDSEDGLYYIVKSRVIAAM